MSGDKVDKPSREPGRPQKPLAPKDGPLPALAQALRDLREASGNPTYRSLQAHAGIAHQRLAEAARGEHLPAWRVVEGYVNGCQSYYRHRHQSPLPADRLAGPGRWRQLYQDAGGVLPEAGQRGDADAGLAAHPVPAATGSLHSRRILAGAAGVALFAWAAVLIGASPPGRPGQITGAAGIFVTPPAPACGNVTADRLRSPATTAFSAVSTVGTLGLDGFSVSSMAATQGRTSYYWVQAHPTESRAGMQLRWSSSPGQWHYCTASLDSGNVAAAPDLVVTMAVPAAIHGRQVLYQACVWHQHPYSARCSQIYGAGVA